MQNLNPKISNRTLLSLLLAFIIIIMIWLVGYFTGIDEGKERIQNNLAQKEATLKSFQETTAETDLPSLPKLPQVSEKSAIPTNLSSLPKLP